MERGSAAGARDGGTEAGHAEFEGVKLDGAEFEGAVLDGGGSEGARTPSRRSVEGGDESAVKLGPRASAERRRAEGGGGMVETRTGGGAELRYPGGGGGTEGERRRGRSVWLGAAAGLVALDRADWARGVLERAELERAGFVLPPPARGAGAAALERAAPLARPRRRVN